MIFEYPTAFNKWGREEFAAIGRVIESQNFTSGKEVAEFEIEFAAYHGMKFGVMVNSGSSANLIAVASLFHKSKNPLKRGDKAIVPAIAWSTTYAPLVQMGMELMLADCDDTWCAASYNRGVWDDDPRLVVGCSVLGNPAYLNLLSGYGDDVDAYFIEDNCESLGASIDGKLCGTFGLLNTFSFFYSHQLSAIEGGMILTDDYELYRLCRMLRAHGWTRDIDDAQSFAEEYDFRLFGYNVRPLEMHAAIAREQLKKQDEFAKWRRRNYETFVIMMRGSDIQMPKVNGVMNPFGIHFTVPTTELRMRLVTELRANGIDCRLPCGGSFRKHKYGKPWADQQTPNADRIHSCGIFLGNAPFDITRLIEKAAGVIKEVI